MIIPLKERLRKAASLVGTLPSSRTAPFLWERCAGRIVVSDVGCDHAYLSCYLLLEGLCDEVVASDVRQGPLEAARQNILRFGCEDRIHTVLTNGLQGIEAYSPTDIVICGMGGETIITILSEAPFIQKKGMRLILQPMTGAAELALYLVANGFRLSAERYALEGTKSYRILSAVYDGTEHTLGLSDALIGTLFFSEDAEAYSAYCRKMAATVRKKLQAQPDNAALTSLLEEIQKRDIVFMPKEGF